MAIGIIRYIEDGLTKEYDRGRKQNMSTTKVMSTTTPRTDAEIAKWPLAGQQGRLVPTDFARKLEIEIQRLQNQLEELKQANQAMNELIASQVAKNNKVIAELNKDKERLDWLDEDSPRLSYHLGWLVRAGDEESDYGLVRTANGSDPNSVRKAIDTAISSEKGSK